VRIFTTRSFNRLRLAQEVGCVALINAVEEMNKGIWDASLGSHLYKKRVALQGRGKKGGARTLLAFKCDDKAYFLYGFAKSQRGNITYKEKQVLKLLARELISYDDEKLNKALKHGALTELEIGKI